MARRLAVAVSHAPGFRGLRFAALFQGGEEGFLREVFGEADVAGGLDAPEGFDGAV